MDVIGIWSAAVGWVLALHREIYLDLGVHMRALATGSAAPFALVLAFLLGLLHALTPGHGKSVVFVYFLGRAARPLAGLAMGLRIAAVHVATGAALFFALREVLGAMGMGGRDGQALRLLSHAAIALIGLWLLRSACRDRRPDTPYAHGALGAAVGLLPCPMTLLLLGYAAANASLGVGLLLVATMGLGIATTLGAMAAGTILARSSLDRWLGLDETGYARATRPIAVASAAMVAAIGASLLTLELWSPAARPFG